MGPTISEVGAGNRSNLWTYNSTIDDLLTLKDDGLLGHTTTFSSKDRGTCESFLAFGFRWRVMWLAKKDGR
jgi:hypothetical protein